MAQVPSLDTAMADTTQEYVELTSGKRIYGTLEVDAPAFGPTRLLLNDSLAYEREALRAYQDDSGYYRRTDDDKWMHLVDDDGLLNLWTTSEWRVGMAHTTLGPNGSMQPTMGFPHQVNVDYFSTAEGPVQEVSYGNLKPVVADHPESMRYLRQHRTLKVVQWMLVGAGVAIMFGSATQASGDDDVPTGVYIGGGVAVSAWIPGLARQGKLRQAIDAYNRSAEHP